MGVYLIVAIAIFVFGVCGDIFSPKPPKGKLPDTEAFCRFSAKNWQLSRKELERIMYRDFYFTPEELERRKAERRRELAEPIYKRHGLKYPEDNKKEA